MAARRTPENRGGCGVCPRRGAAAQGSNPFTCSMRTFRDFVVLLGRDLVISRFGKLGDRLGTEGEERCSLHFIGLFSKGRGAVWSETLGRRVFQDRRGGVERGRGELEKVALLLPCYPLSGYSSFRRHYCCVGVWVLLPPSISRQSRRTIPLVEPSWVCPDRFHLRADHHAPPRPGPPHPAPPQWTDLT